MAVTLSALASDKVKTVIKYGDDTVTIYYRPMMVTDEKLSKIDSDKEIEAWLLETIVSWDIKETAKKKLPITKTGLSKLPRSLQRAIFAGLLRAGVDDEEPTPSGNE